MAHFEEKQRIYWPFRDPTAIRKLDIAQKVRKTGAFFLEMCFAIWKSNLGKGKRGDLISYNSMMTALINCNREKEALRVYEELSENTSFEPDEISFILGLTACTLKNEEEMGEKICKNIRKKGSAFLQFRHGYGAENKIKLWTSLIHFFGNNGDYYLQEIEALENNLNLRIRIDNDESKEKIRGIFNALIGGYGKNRQIDKAFRVFHSMKKRGVTKDEITYVNMTRSQFFSA